MRQQLPEANYQLVLDVSNKALTLMDQREAANSKTWIVRTHLEPKLGLKKFSVSQNVKYSDCVKCFSRMLRCHSESDL